MRKPVVSDRMYRVLDLSLLFVPSLKTIERGSESRRVENDAWKECHDVYAAWGVFKHKFRKRVKEQRKFNP